MTYAELAEMGKDRIDNLSGEQILSYANSQDKALWVELNIFDQEISFNSRVGEQMIETAELLIEKRIKELA